MRGAAQLPSRAGLGMATGKYKHQPGMSVRQIKKSINFSHDNENKMMKYKKSNNGEQTEKEHEKDKKEKCETYLGCW